LIVDNVTEDTRLNTQLEHSAVNSWERLLSTVNVRRQRR